LATASTTHFWASLCGTVQDCPTHDIATGRIMTSTQPTPIDIASLKRDILDKDPLHALPANMSDFWLSAISASLDHIFECADDENAQQYLSGPLAVILHLLHGKSNSEIIELSGNTFRQYLNNYRVEVALELISRATTASISKATLDTIFTDREVSAS
jgi:hypothetical protein